MEVIECPRCHKGGSYQLLPRKNAYGSIYHYWYVGHYAGLADGEGIHRTRKVRWCYVGKRAPSDVRATQGNPGKEPRAIRSNPE